MIAQFPAQRITNEIDRLNARSDLFHYKLPDLIFEEEKGGSKGLSLTIVQSFYSEFRNIYPQVVYLFLKHQYLCIWIRGKISGSSCRPKNNTTKSDLGYQQPSGTCLRWRSARWSRCARSTDMGSAACSSPRRTTSCPDTSTWNLTSRLTRVYPPKEAWCCIKKDIIKNTLKT